MRTRGAVSLIRFAAAGVVGAGPVAGDELVRLSAFPHLGPEAGFATMALKLG